MNIKNIPNVIYRNIDERRESLIVEQLASGLLAVHPDDKKTGAGNQYSKGKEFNGRGD